MALIALSLFIFAYLGGCFVLNLHPKGKHSNRLELKTMLIIKWYLASALCSGIISNFCF